MIKRNGRYPHSPRLSDTEIASIRRREFAIEWNSMSFIARLGAWLTASMDPGIRAMEFRRQAPLFGKLGV